MTRTQQLDRGLRGDVAEPREPIHAFLADRHKTLGILVRQRPEVHTVRNAEDQRYRGDTDGECEPGHRGEARGATKLAHGVTNIGSEMVEHSLSRKRLSTTTADPFP